VQQASQRRQLQAAGRVAHRRCSGQQRPRTCRFPCATWHYSWWRAAATHLWAGWQSSVGQARRPCCCPSIRRFPGVCLSPACCRWCCSCQWCSRCHSFHSSSGVVGFGLPHSLARRHLWCCPLLLRVCRRC
jgi:hypothetical protein